MREINRAVHIDFHTMPGIEDFGANIDPAEIAETFQKAHIDYVNLFARCNIGFSYYPTKIGYPYPGMQGNLLGDLITECHKRDIGVTAYINGGLHHELLLHHPEYMRVDKEGQVHKGDPAKNNFFRSPCLNTGYREFFYEEIKEVMALKPDGIFLDCVRAEACYCPACLAKMEALGIDTEDEEAVLRYAGDLQIEAFREIRAMVPEDMRLFFNSFPYDMIADLTSHFELECLPYSGWWYDFFTVMAPYYRNIKQDRVYMTGRFLQSWGDFGGNKPAASMEFDVQDALLYGYAPSIGDHMHPRDGLDQSLYENIGKIFEYVEKLEPWTKHTKAVTEVAVLGNKAAADKRRPTPEDIGAARMLAELKVCYDVIHEDMDLTPYRLVIIPENVIFTEALLEKLKAYEGFVLSAGNSICEGGIWDYISEYETDKAQDAFYTWQGSTLGQYIPGIRMKSEYSISDYVEPYFERAYDGRHGYVYIPPKGPNGYSAIAKKGCHAHICFHIFGAYQKYRAHFHKALVKDLLDAWMPDRLLLAEELPASARVTLMEGKERILHVKVTYPEISGQVGIVEEPTILAAGRRIKVKGAYQKVCRLPDMQEIACSVQGGYTEIVLPEICGYAPFLLSR